MTIWKHGRKNSQLRSLTIKEDKKQTWSYITWERQMGMDFIICNGFEKSTLRSWKFKEEQIYLATSPGRSKWLWVSITVQVLETALSKIQDTGKQCIDVWPGRRIFICIVTHIQMHGQEGDFLYTQQDIQMHRQQFLKFCLYKCC